MYLKTSFEFSGTNSESGTSNVLSIGVFYTLYNTDKEQKTHKNRIIFEIF